MRRDDGCFPHRVRQSPPTNAERLCVKEPNGHRDTSCAHQSTCSVRTRVRQGSGLATSILLPFSPPQVSLGGDFPQHPFGWTPSLPTRWDICQVLAKISFGLGLPCPTFVLRAQNFGFLTSFYDGSRLRVDPARLFDSTLTFDPSREAPITTGHTDPLRSTAATNKRKKEAKISQKPTKSNQNYDKKKNPPPKRGALTFLITNQWRKPDHTVPQSWIPPQPEPSAQDPIAYGVHLPNPAPLVQTCS